MDQQVYQLNQPKHLHLQELATMSNLKELISAQNILKKIYQTKNIYIYIYLCRISVNNPCHQRNSENYRHLTINDISTKVKSIKYKILVPALRIKNVKQRFSYLKFTSIFLKTTHSMLMLKHHQIKIDPNTEPTCDYCKVVETPHITSSTASSTK